MVLIRQIWWRSYSIISKSNVTTPLFQISDGWWCQNCGCNIKKIAQRLARHVALAVRTLTGASPFSLKAYGAEAKWRPSSVWPSCAIDSYIKGRRKPCDQKDIILSTGLQGTNGHIIVKAHSSSKGLPLRMWRLLQLKTATNSYVP